MSAWTNWVVHAEDAPALTEIPITVPVVELKPDEVTRMGAMNCKALVLKKPVVVFVRSMNSTPSTTADVPEPTDLKFAQIMNRALSIAAVWALGKVKVQIAASDVVPAVPILRVIVAVATPAAVFVMSMTAR